MLCEPKGWKIPMKTRTFTMCTALLIALILGVTFLGLYNRGKTTPPVSVTKSMSRGFDATATITMRDLTMTGDINRTAQGACTLAIKEPKHLRGMTFVYDGKDIAVSYKGIKVKLDENSKAVSSAVRVIVDALDKAGGDTGVDVKVEGKAVTVKGESDSGKFAITLDKQNGSVASIKLDELDFECNFDDFIFAK